MRPGAVCTNWNCSNAAMAIKQVHKIRRVDLAARGRDNEVVLAADVERHQRKGRTTTALPVLQTTEVTELVTNHRHHAIGQRGHQQPVFAIDRYRFKLHQVTEDVEVPMRTLQADIRHLAAAVLIEYRARECRLNRRALPVVQHLGR